MPITLTIANKTYEYPVPGEDPSWGQPATDTIVAIVDVLNTLLSPGDILTTTANINNNVSIATDITGLAFDPTQVRAGNIDYAIYRISTDYPSGNTENGTIFIVYDNDAPIGQKWTLSQRINGGAGVSFSITDSGQVQYISTDIDDGAGGYSGEIRFQAKTLFP